MNICFVTREFPGSSRCGGIGYYVYNQAIHLQKKGHNVTIVTTTDTDDKIVLDEDIKIIRLSFYDYVAKPKNRIWKLFSLIKGFLFYIPYRIQVYFKILRLFENNSIDIVEFPEFGAESLFFMMSKLKGRAIIRIHGPSIIDNSNLGNTIKFKKAPVRYISSILEMFCLKKASYVISVSNNMLEKVGSYINKDAVVATIYNGLNVNCWDMREGGRDAEKTNTFNIFTAGTITETKGIDELIKSCIEIRNEYSININLTIAGKESHYSNQLKSKFNDQCWLSIIGPILQEELRSRYASADLCCFPSWWESFGLACAEAMASGSLVLASDIGGLSEIIDNDLDGFLVKPKNKSELKVKILEIYKMSTDRKNTVRFNARKKIKTKFEMEKMLSSNIEFYNKVVINNDV